MKKAKNSPRKFSSISELHKALGFPKPLHPLISLVDYADIKVSPGELPDALLLNCYKISYKKGLTAKIRYGQGHYDFNEGGLSFVAPNQVIASHDEPKDYAGYTLLLHPDYLHNYRLAAKISAFGFFSYAASEALLLSAEERQVIVAIFDQIRNELHSSMDDLSQDIIISHIEVLLNYSNRFYKRRFVSGKHTNNELIVQMEQLLNNYFDNGNALKTGLPTVEYLAHQLNRSPRYLSDMLRTLTGQNAQQHIHEKLIEKAKTSLSATNQSVAEVAFMLGFEHPQSFSKWFKNKTGITPTQFRQSWN